jgi:hypothetical protein
VSVLVCSSYQLNAAEVGCGTEVQVQCCNLLLLLLAAWASRRLVRSKLMLCCNMDTVICMLLCDMPMLCCSAARGACLAVVLHGLQLLILLACLVLFRVELQLRGRAVAAGRSSRQMTVTVQLSQPSGSSVASSSRTYESSDAAVDGATDLAAAAAQAAANYYAAAVTDTSSSSSSTSEGLTLNFPHQQQEQQPGGVVFGASDLLLWRWLVCLKLEGAARQAVGQVAPLAGNGELQQDFQVGLRA